MPVTLTTTQLAAAIRVGDGTTAPAEPLAGILTRLLSVATSTIDQYAPGAPDDVQNEAAIRLAGYLYDLPAAARGSGHAAAFVNSGAAALLGPWRVRRAGTDPGAATPADVPSTGGLDRAEVEALIQAALASFGGGVSEQRVEDLIAAHAYTLPAAAAGVRGGVQAVSNALIDEGTSTGVFGWMISHVRRVVESVVPTWARSTTPPRAVPSDGSAGQFLRRGADADGVARYGWGNVRELPTGGTDGQYVGRADGAAAWLDAPGGGSPPFQVTHGLGAVANDVFTKQSNGQTDTLQVTAGSTAALMLVATTDAASRWWFEFPANRTVGRIVAALGGGDVTADWSQVGGSNLWYYSGPSAFRTGTTLALQVHFSPAVGANDGITAQAAADLIERVVPSWARNATPPRELPAGGSDGQFVGRADGAAAWVNAPGGGGSTYTQVGNAATVSGGNSFTFDGETRTAFRTAWNAGTYNGYILECKYSANNNNTYWHFQVPRLPSLETLGSDIERYSLVAASWFSDNETDLVLAVSSGALSLSGADSSFFNAGTTCTIYGVS